MLKEVRGGASSIYSVFTFFTLSFYVTLTIFLIIFAFFTGGVSILVDNSSFHLLWFISLLIGIGVSGFLLLGDGSVHEKINHNLPWLSSWDGVSEAQDFSGEEIEHKGN